MLQAESRPSASRCRISARAIGSTFIPGLFGGSCPACRSDERSTHRLSPSAAISALADSQREYDAYPYGGICEYIIAPVHNLTLGWGFASSTRRVSAISDRCGLRKRAHDPGKTVLIINGAQRNTWLGAALDGPRAGGVTRILACPRPVTALLASRRWRRTRIDSMTEDGTACCGLGAFITGGHGVDAVIDVWGRGASGALADERDLRAPARRQGGQCRRRRRKDAHGRPLDDGPTRSNSSAATGSTSGDMARRSPRWRPRARSIFRYSSTFAPLAEVNRALDGSQFRDGGFTNLVIVL